MKLLIADDHVLFRDTLVEYLERLLPDAQVSAVDTFDAAYSCVERDRFDLVLLDFKMPGMDGLKGFRTMRSRYPDLKVALMSGVAEPYHVADAVESGAVGYFPKTLAGARFVDAIKEVLDGGCFIPVDSTTGRYTPSYHADLIYGDAPTKAPVRGANGSGNGVDSEANDVPLTPREMDVMQYLAQGWTNKQIADELSLQVVTIKLHVRGICQKLHVANRTQAALKATDLGLV